jgi:hypothetical protein
VVAIRDIISRRIPGEIAAREPVHSFRRNFAHGARKRLRPALIRFVGLYVRDDLSRSGYVSTGPYHVDRVFRSWR